MGCDAETFISGSSIPYNCELRKNHKGDHKCTLTLSWKKTKDRRSEES